MARESNWEKHGYETAKGKRGTGWMTFGDSDINDLIKKFPISEYPDGIPVEGLDESAHGWLETVQWEYEAGNSMIEWAKRDAKKEGEPENWIYFYGDKQSEWEMGFVQYMIEILNKKGIKINND